jgi:N-acetyl-gamma-glutamyl-phosphate reductase
VTSDSEAGRAVADLYPALSGVELAYTEHDVVRVAEMVGVAFLAVPHTKAMAIAPGLLEAGTVVVDLSADFRLADAETYESWYGVAHAAPDLLPEAAYGLPEIDRRRLKDASLIACPGCYPTATLIAAVPALEAGHASGRVVVDAKSGVSGAGRGATDVTHYCFADESIGPYGVASHRHTPEIAAGLANASGSDMPLAFVPHLTPMKRGLLSTVYLDAAPGLSAERVHEVYAERYADEPFVTVHPAGRMPTTGEVTGTNRAHVGVALDAASSTLVVACAIDNLLKGASGQAVQCANIALGFEETTGLEQPGTAV